MTDETTEEENQEGLIFAKITRYIAEQITQDAEDDDEDDDDGNEDQSVRETVGLYLEIAEAFEIAGGFEFEAEQALSLSQAMALLTAAMRALSEQAHQQKQPNAAAKMEWAAMQATMMTAKLQECYLAASSGFITISDEQSSR
ncbi:MAG: hypothetical protein OQJ97_06470 [Rhodospirillales bacterium]|nr:hypothetical protein [Rhodospirillales bacterium]